MKLPTAIRLFFNDKRLTMPEFHEPGHALTAGMTDVGKSCLLVEYIRESFKRNIPVVYIDPKGDTDLKIKGYLGFTKEGRIFWERYKHRILFVNPVAACDHIVGFNALEPVMRFNTATIDQLALTADTITAQLRKQSMFGEGEAMRMQTILWATIGALIDGGHGRYTMREMSQVFRPSYYQDDKGKDHPSLYNPFLESLLSEVRHNGVRDFWYNRWPGIPPQARQDWFQSTYNRIYQYYFDERVELTTCTVEHARLDFQKIADQGYWVFVNIPFRFLSEEKTSLIGNFIVTQYFLACMRRGFGGAVRYLFLDEARFFNLAPLDMIMNLARASGMYLHLVVQNINQLRRSREGRIDESLKDAVMENVRYWQVFGDTEDAEELANLMFPLSGQQLRMIRSSGDPDFHPPQVEQNIYASYFKSLPKRHVILWDKMGGERPAVWKTPDIPIADATEEQISMFEAEHLTKTGVPAKFIRDEIRERTARIDALFEVQTPSKPTGKNLPKPSDLRRPQ